MPEYTQLTGDDLISNEPLRGDNNARISDDADVFQHRRVARRVAQLIAAPGTNVNIAVNAPWGSGKSSFFGLLKEELADLSASGKTTFNAIDFDAWQMADETFESNFLATVADGVPNSPKDIEQRLFRANRTVTLPLGMDVPDRWRRLVKIVLIVMTVLLVFGIPAVQVASDANAPATHDVWSFFWSSYMPKLVAWLGAAAGGTLLVVIIGTVTNLWKVQVQESGPAHVTQFRKLFAHILRNTTATQVILIDELDRCEPVAVMRTLEGLRRFLGAERCVFVVAFDRESVVETVQSELARKIPARPGRPYYSTAGEYLDKIFTYQVALPPQPRKAFRKYATDLVTKKTENGVWAQLRGEDQGRLNEVLSILSPPHLTSPRRTKVILNDFAINARIAESYEVAWVERAQEIAVLTVLQTEFPLFYADLEHYPNLLTHVSGRAVNAPGEHLQPLLEKYLHEGAAPEKVLAEGDEETRTALRRQLGRFLEKLNDMHVPLPGADLIQLGAGKQMLEFSDPSIFAAVEAATEVPRAETLATLRAAKPYDLYRALQLMLADIEGETSAEATTLRVLTGTLIPALDAAQSAALRPQINGAWERMMSTKSVDQLTEDAATGFLSVLAPSKVPAWVSDALRATYGDVNLHVPALEALIASATDKAIIHAQDRFLRSAVDLVPEPSEPFLSLLRRLDAAGATRFGATLTRELRERLDTDETAENDEETLQHIHDLKESLLALIAELSPASAVRAWIVTLFRTRALVDASTGAEAEYVGIIDRDLKTTDFRTVGAQEVLRALAANPPATLRALLAARVPSDVDVDPKLLMPALTTLMDMVLADETGPDNATQHAIANIVAIAGTSSHIDTARILSSIEILFTSSTLLPRARHEFIIDVAHSLASLPAASPVFDGPITTLVVNSVKALPDTSDAVHVLQRLRRESEPILQEVAAQLTELLPGTHGRRKWIIDTILCAHHRLHRLSAPAPPLPADLIDPYIAQSADQSALRHWVETGPPAADVIAVLHGARLSSLPAESWEDYSERASTAEATTLWEKAAQAGEPMETLRALASGGIADTARVKAGRQLAHATNSTSRRTAFRIFDTLPADKDTATAVVAPLIDWLGGARKNEAWMVFDLLIRHRNGFDRAELARVKRMVPHWLDKAGHKLSSDRKRRLASAGYIPATRRRPR